MREADQVEMLSVQELSQTRYMTATIISDQEYSLLLYVQVKLQAVYTLKSSLRIGCIIKDLGIIKDLSTLICLFFSWRAFLKGKHCLSQRFPTKG